jgi:hypothetical protein
MISKATTNSKPSTLPKAETQPTNKFDTIRVNIKTPSGVEEVNLQFIMQQLGRKIAQIGNNKNAAEKYVNLKNTLQSAVSVGSSSDDIQNMINRSGIEFSTDGKMKGGINKKKEDFYITKDLTKVVENILLLLPQKHQNRRVQEKIDFSKPVVENQKKNNCLRRIRHN